MSYSGATGMTPNNNSIAAVRESTETPNLIGQPMLFFGSYAKIPNFRN